MPYALSVSPIARSARIHVTGTLTGEEIIAACRETFTHADWQRGFSTLWDARDLRALLLLPSDIGAFATAAREVADLRGPGRSAIVTFDPAVQLNALLLGLKSQGRDDREVRVFGRLDVAEEWLSAGVCEQTNMAQAVRSQRGSCS